MTVVNQYLQFIDRLDYFKKQKVIKILKRGTTKDFAFRQFLLDPDLNTLDEFGEKLFYFGEKSRYFWENKVSNAFKIGETDAKVFQYIFQEFKRLANSHEIKLGTKTFKENNKLAFDFFAEVSNCDVFKSAADSIKETDKRKYINYYLRVLHQLREFGYENHSINVSGTERESTAMRYARNEIIIDFWDFDFNRFESTNSLMPSFIGKPYKHEKEISVFGVIFPQFIHSFSYEGVVYCNPNMFKETNLDSMILSGFDIDQSDFKKRFKNETINKTALIKTGGVYTEIE